GRFACGGCRIIFEYRSDFMIDLQRFFQVRWVFMNGTTASQNQFFGRGNSVEEALKDAAREALKSGKPRGIDDEVRIKVNSIKLVYGGIIGLVGTREVTVSLEPM